MSQIFEPSRSAQQSTLENPNDSTPSRPTTIELSPADLTLFFKECQSNANATASPESQTFSERVMKEFQAVIEVVETRKEMEKVLEIEALQSAHSSVLLNLIDQNLASQKNSTQLAEKCKLFEKTQLLDAFQDLALPSECKVPLSSDPNLVLHEVKQSLQAELGQLFGQTDKDDKEKGRSESLETSKQQQSFSASEEDWRMGRNLYRQQFREQLFRDELINERENIFFNYKESNRQLFEALLSQKEKENNLKKTEREKYEHWFKQRHQSDIELEKLIYNQSQSIATYQQSLLESQRKIRTLENSLQECQDQFSNTLSALTQEISAEKQLYNTLQLQHQALKMDKNSSLKAISQIQQRYEKISQQTAQNYQKLESANAKLLEEVKAQKQLLDERTSQLEDLHFLKKQNGQSELLNIEKIEVLTSQLSQQQSQLEETRMTLKSIQKKLDLKEQESSQLLESLSQEQSGAKFQQKIHLSTVSSLEQKISNLEDQLELAHKRCREQKKYEESSSDGKYSSRLNRRSPDQVSEKELFGELGNSETQKQILAVFLQQSIKNAGLIDETISTLSHLLPY